MEDANFRAEVVKTAKKAEENGLCQYKSGNFSMIDRDNGVVYITPSGISRDELTSAMIAKIDIDGNVLEGDFAPSIEVAMHLSAYRARPEAGAVVHTHSRYATIFASMGKEILPVSLEAVHYGGAPVPVTEFGMAGSEDIAEKIVKPLQNSKVCLLKYHGSLAVGDNMDQALLNAIYVEEVALIYYHMLAIGFKDFMPQELFEGALA